MPKFVSVHSVRHGIGKSHITANLAVGLAHQGHRVGILDTTEPAAGVHTLFSLNEFQQDSLWNEFLWNRETTLDTAAEESLFVQVGAGKVAVLGRGAQLTNTGIHLGEIMQRLRQGEDPDSISQGFLDVGDRLQLDYLLLDPNPGVHEEALLMLAFVDALLLVLGADQQDYQSTSVLVDLARRLEIPDLWLVLNLVSAEFQCKEVQQQLELTLGASIAGVLPFTENLLTFSSQGIFCQHFPDHPWSIEIRAIAQFLMPPQRSGVPPVDMTPAFHRPDIQPASASAKLAGLRMLDLLTLPDPQRQTLNWMLRQGSVTLAEVAAQVGQDPEQVKVFLESLVERGFVKTVEGDNEVRYVPNLVSRKSGISRDFWQMLDA